MVSVVRENRIKQIFFAAAVIATLLVAIDILYFVVLKWCDDTRGIDTTNQVTAFMFDVMPRISSVVAFLACVLGVYCGYRIERNLKQKTMLFLSLVALLLSISLIPFTLY